MLTRIMVAVALLTMFIGGALIAQAETDIASPVNTYTIIDATDSGSEVSPKTLAALSDWIASNFGLPAPRDLPTIEFATRNRIAQISRGGLVGPTPMSAAGVGDQPHVDQGVVAVYVNTTHTIYLPEGWRGTEPRDVSVLVHELVHHMQHQAGIKYPCSEAREKLAYRAQERWLARAGLSLHDEFQVDRMTLLVRTNCML